MLLLQIDDHGYSIICIRTLTVLYFLSYVWAKTENLSQILFTSRGDKQQNCIRWNWRRHIQNSAMKSVCSWWSLLKPTSSNPETRSPRELHDPIIMVINTQGSWSWCSNFHLLFCSVHVRTWHTRLSEKTCLLHVHEEPRHFPIALG